MRLITHIKKLERARTGTMFGWFRGKCVSLVGLFRRPLKLHVGEVLPVVDRKPCPFYGFAGFGTSMIGGTGNGCGLAGAHSPCSMQAAGEKPCWDNCSTWNHANNAESVNELLDTVRVFPDELKPKDAREWGGIGGKQWFCIVMERCFP